MVGGEPEDEKVRAARSPEIDRVVRAALALGSSSDTVTDAAARTLGLNRTDMRLVAIVRARRRLTAGQLAAAADLSPAATSTAVRRLLTSGYVDRAEDSHDARRSWITLTPAGYAALDEVYSDMINEGRIHLSTYSVADLDLIETFLAATRRVQLEGARRLLAQGRRGTDEPPEG
ncbi:MAG: MarR family winged helix-turn-helix transcriptional regulator [Propionibacteriaceae bacterium]